MLAPLSCYVDDRTDHLVEQTEVELERLTFLRKAAGRALLDAVENGTVRNGLRGFDIGIKIADRKKKWHERLGRMNSTGFDLSWWRRRAVEQRGGLSVLPEKALRPTLELIMFYVGHSRPMCEKKCAVMS
jgi:hypothetical protein